MFKISTKRIKLIFLILFRYSDNFAAAGIVSIEQVARLGLTQLVDLGVTLVGHQKKIINSIQVSNKVNPTTFPETP